MATKTFTGGDAFKDVVDKGKDLDYCSNIGITN